MAFILNAPSGDYWYFHLNDLLKKSFGSFYVKHHWVVLFCFVLNFIYLCWERGAEAERERWRERIPSRLRAVSAEPNAGLELTNHEIMTCAEIKSQMINQMIHPGAPDFCFCNELHMMFVDISIKMLISGPLVRNVICHNNLLLVGKPNTTGIILTFPGVQPIRNETRMTVCTSTNTLITVWVCMFTHRMQWNHLQSLQMAPCMLILFPVRGTGGILDVRNSSLLFGLFSNRTLNPAARTSLQVTRPLNWPLWLEPLSEGRGEMN